MQLRQKWENPIHQKGHYKLTFADTEYSISTTAANLYTGKYIFRGNGPYDPDQTGVGVQPYGWDQLFGANTFYYNYECLASKIKIHLTATESFAGEVRIMLLPTRNTTLPQDAADIRRIPGCKTICWTYNDGGRGSNIRAYMSTRKIFPDVARDDASFNSNYASLPTLQWYWYLMIDTSSGNRELTFKFDCEIKYYVLGARSYSDVQES